MPGSGPVSTIAGLRGLLEWAGRPRWGLLVGLGLAAGLLVAGLVYLLARDRSPPTVRFLVAVAFVMGGFTGFLVAADQDFALEYPSRPCEAGPWTAQWQESHGTYVALSANGTGNGTELSRVFPPGNGTRGPWGGPGVWTGAKTVSATWTVPDPLTGNASSVEVRVDEPGEAGDLRIRIEMSGGSNRSQAREIARQALANLTGASQTTVETWARELPVTHAAPAYLELAGVLPGARFDPGNLIKGTGPHWTPVSEGVQVHPFLLVDHSDALFHGPGREDRDPLAGFHRSGNWTLGVRPAVKVATGSVNGTGFRFAVTGTGAIALQADAYLPASAWQELAGNVYQELGLGEAPSRTWDPSPGAVC